MIAVSLQALSERISVSLHALYGMGYLSYLQTVESSGLDRGAVDDEVCAQLQRVLLEERWNLWATAP